MGDWIELENGEIVARSYSGQTGRYHSDTILKLANNNTELRGKALEFLKKQLPPDSPYRRLTTVELAKLGA